MARDPGYTVFARRYRPLGFDEVAGQEHVSQTLKNAISEKRVGHAYLFTGPRGVGKTSMARILAKALNCVKGPTGAPCMACEICLAVHEGTDADVIEMDAASNRLVEDARSLREGIRYAPLRARSKVYIIDEAHMLTREAFNTLLKTLEEPPPHVKFIFATTEAHKLPDTIVSRCQRFDFRRITTADIARRLKQVADREKLVIDEAVLSAVARAGHGSMRDAESVLDQLVSFKAEGLAATDVSAVLGEARGNHLADLVAALQSGDAAKVFTSLASIFAGGVDTAAFTDQLLSHFRALLGVKACGKNADVVDLPEADLADCEKQASGFTLEALLYAIQLVLEAKRRIKEGANPRIVLEVTLVKLARSSDLVTLAEALRGGFPARAEALAPAPARAPAPEAPAAAPPEPSGPPGDLQEGQAAWARVVATVKEKSVLAGALLQAGQLTRFAGDDLTFSLPARFSKFNLDQLEKNRAPVEAAVQSVFGRKLAVKFMLETGGGADPAAARKAALPQADATSDPGVRKILETFGGSRVVGIE